MIINFLDNIIYLINVQEFRQRFISTTILSLLFMLVFILGNPYVSIFFSILFSFVFFEYEKLNSKVLRKKEIFRIIFFQMMLLFFTLFEIFEIKILPLIFTNYIMFIIISILRRLGPQRVKNIGA